MANEPMKRKEKSARPPTNTGILGHAGNSNRLTPTYKSGLITTEKPVFGAMKNGVANSSGSNFVPRKVLKNARGFPYRKARLIDHNGSLTQPWYIVFYAWDIGFEKLVRKRLGKKELNTIKSPAARRAKAAEMIATLNEELKQGGHLDTPPQRTAPPAFDFHGYKLLNALTWVEHYKRDIEKRDKGTVAHFRYLRNLVERFIKHEGLDRNTLLRQLTPTFTTRLAMYLRDTLAVSNKTFNDKLGRLHTAIELLRTLDRSLFREGNPVQFKKLKTVAKKHAAYTLPQLEQLRKLIEPTDPQLLLFIRFLYHTLARPGELRFLKVAHVRTDVNRVLIEGETAKTDREYYVGMSPTLRQIIEASGILTYPPDYYVFSELQQPGPRHVGINYFNKRFAPYLRASGLKKVNPHFTLYSFKHTGAVQLYLATKDPELIQRQCRHTNIHQTTTYLRDLGLFTNFDGLDKLKGF